MIHITSDFSEIDRELDRLTRLPSAHTKELLDDVLHAGFKATQAEVHVITGALKASGKEESSVNKVAEVWEGEITYGTPGDGGPVDYAIYEKARGGGSSGDHDFMRPLKALDPAFRAAMKKAMRP